MFRTLLRFSLAISLVGCLTAWLLVPCLASAQVWSATEAWDDQWEKKYGDWVSNSFHERFFLENEWAGIETDCADAVYAARVIFSFKNSLPFAISGSRDRRAQFANTTKDFDSIADPAERVKAFIDRINGRTWTGSLAKHTYPIETSKSAVVPGTIWLKPGHVEIIKRVRPTGIVELQGCFKPVVFSSIQPEISGTNALELNQWISSFEESVRAQLAGSSIGESKTARITRLSQDFCRMVHARQDVVHLGFQYLTHRMKLLNDKEACLVPKEYHLFSTPSRDSNLRRVVIALS